MSSAGLTRDFSTAAAMPVAIGTAATRPMLPTSVRTISTATTSRIAVVAMAWRTWLNNSSNGSAAPA